MSAIDETIRAQQEEIRRVELGMWSGDLDKLKERLAELFKEREDQYEEYYRIMRTMEYWEPNPPSPPLPWTPMSMDEYLDSHGNIRTQKYVEGHH